MTTLAAVGYIVGLIIVAAVLLFGVPLVLLLIGVAAGLS